MNITELNGYNLAERMTKADSLNNNSRSDKINARTESLRDQVNMSELSRLISENADKLSDLHKIRPEKIQEFQNYVNKPPKFADDTVDAIFRKLSI